MKKRFFATFVFLILIVFIIPCGAAFALDPGLAGALAWGAAQASGATFLVPQNMDTDLFGKTIGIGTDWTGPVEINISDSHSGYSTVSIHGDTLYEQLQNFTNTEIVPKIEVGQNITFTQIYGTVGGYPLTYYKSGEGRYYTAPFDSLGPPPSSMSAPFGATWHSTERVSDPGYFNFFVGSSSSSIIRRLSDLPYYACLGYRPSTNSSFAASCTIIEAVPVQNSIISINAPVKMFSSSLKYNSSGASDLPSNTDYEKHALTMTVPTGDLQSGEYQNETDINDILSYIAELIENQTTIISEIVIDGSQPAPPPTPRPTTEPAIDILGGINDIIGQLDEGLNDIKLDNYNIIESLNDLNFTNSEILEGLNDINTTVYDGLTDINDSIDTQGGVVSGAIEQAINDIDSAIGTQTGVISGAIDQAVSDVQEAIGEQTAVLDESLSATAEGVETIVEAIEDEAINWRKFDLKGLFPFCIPFDIYNMLKALDASPTAPHVQIPFVIQSIGFSYMLDLDFSVFDPVAAIMRQMELICYGLALAWATSKVIKW